MTCRSLKGALFNGQPQVFKTYFQLIGRFRPSVSATSCLGWPREQSVRPPWSGHTRQVSCVERAQALAVCHQQIRLFVEKTVGTWESEMVVDLVSLNVALCPVKTLYAGKGLIWLPHQQVKRQSKVTKRLFRSVVYTLWAASKRHTRYVVTKRPERPRITNHVPLDGELPAVAAARGPTPRDNALPHARRFQAKAVLAWGGCIFLFELNTRWFFKIHKLVCRCKEPTTRQRNLTNCTLSISSGIRYLASYITCTHVHGERGFGSVKLLRIST